jgi:sulfonate transport system permease protein
MSSENITLLQSSLAVTAESSLAVTAERTDRKLSVGYQRVATKAWFPFIAHWWDKSIGLILPTGILLGWDLVTRFHFVKPVFLPSPWNVVASFYDMFVNQSLLTDFRVSATVVLQGFIIGSVLGVLTGIFAGLSKTVERFLGPTLNTIRQVPTLAWLPLIVLWIGVGTWAKSIMIGKAVFFPVFLNTLQGIRGVSKEHIEVAKIFEYNRALLLRKVILPAASPSIFVGLRYGAGLAWAFVIAAEMLGGRYGLGYLLMRSQELLLTGQLFVVIFVIGTVGFVVDIGLRRVEKHLLRWKKGFEG